MENFKSKKNLLKNTLFVCIIFINFFLSTNLHAVVWDRAIEFDDLVDKAKYILVVRVKKIRSYYVPLHPAVAKTQFQGKYDKMIMSDITVEIVESFKGDMERQSDEVFVLTQPGGCILNTCYIDDIYPGYPTFRAGKKNILFLEEVGTHKHKKIIFGEHGVKQVTPDNWVEELDMSLMNFERLVKN